MNVKDVVEVTISDSGMNGEGVARLDGRVVFVPYTLSGERVRAVVRSVKRSYAQLSVIKVLLPSPHRVQPVCPHYYKCGGCDAMHYSAEYRRQALLSELAVNLKKIAGIDYTPTAFHSAPSAVRNKLSMPFGVAGGHTVLGLYRRGSHVVEPVDCMLAGELSRAVARAVLDFVREREKLLPVYNEKTGAGLLRHLVVREIAGRASAVLVINGDGLPGDCEAALAAALTDTCDLFICPNTARNNVILGNSVRLVKGNVRLSVDVMGVKALLSPLSFLQVNDGVRDMLYASALSHITSGTLVDLYSGIGITSNLAAKRADRVVAVECVPQAVADADETARLNGNSDKITNVCGTVEKVLPALNGIAGADVLVDPPRKGCGAPVMNAIASLAPQNLIYISCNHATMCRDIKLFCNESAANGNSYTLTSCELFDMFPGTHHIETLICLKRKQPK